MDVSDFDSMNINVFLARIKIDAMRENRDPKQILVRAFVGGHNGEQSTPLTRAFVRVADIYKARNIKLVLQKFTNDIVRNKYHWTCRELFDHLLAADIHLLPTHLHQGMLALGGTDTWNTINILQNLERLRYHLGSNCGKYIDDPVASQDKMAYYAPLEREGLCAPTLAVDISAGDVSAHDFAEIRRFIFKIYNDDKYVLYRNEYKFVVKLPFSTNSTRIKYVTNLDGIMAALREFMTNPRVMGYIHYAMIQPELVDNAEVKIVCFNGVPRIKNAVKKGKHGRSPFRRAKKETFFAFARDVIETIQRVCPALVSHQVLRIDLFGFRGAPGKFIVNEIEGFEAHVTGCGTSSIDQTAPIQTMLEEYWFNEISNLVAYHIDHVMPRIYPDLLR